jgi:hypothetical protein
MVPPPAVPDGDTSLILWAESPEEARRFLAAARRRPELPSVERIFVAKRSSLYRSNNYLAGQYYRTTNDQAVDVYPDVVVAPRSVVDLVQWCTCDLMFTRGITPLVVVEDTSHIVRMNLYQRFPRLAKAAMLGVPAYMLQGTRGLDFRLRGDRWGFARYLQAFQSTFRIHPGSPVLPIWYESAPAPQEAAERDLFDHLIAIVAGDQAGLAALRSGIVGRVNRALGDLTGDEIPPDIRSIQHRGNEVVVRIGARPERKSWREKGSGQMDPYLGLILAAKYIYCYDNVGRRTKDLVVDFAYLPPGFWWFKDPATTALYKRLPFEFADRVRFLG